MISPQNFIPLFLFSPLNNLPMHATIYKKKIENYIIRRVYIILNVAATIRYSKSKMAAGSRYRIRYLVELENTQCVEILR